MFRLLAIPSELTTECTSVRAQYRKDGFIAASFKLFGCELAEDGDQSKHATVR